MVVLYLAGFTVCLLATLFLRHKHLESVSRKHLLRGFAGIVSAILLGGMLFTPTYATTITEYTVPGNPGLWDLSPSNISSVVWFTESGANNIGVLCYNNATLKQIPVPTLNSQPWGIAAVNWPNAAAVFTESYGNKVGLVAANGTRRIAEYSIPTNGSGPRKIVFDPWRNCTWFTEYAAGQIGKLSFLPAPNVWRANITEYKLPGGLSTPSQSNPIGIAIDPIGPNATHRYIWVADFSRRSVVRYLPDNGTFREYSVYPFSPWDVALDADGMVWFTAQRPGTDENIIGMLNPVRSERESAAQSRWALTIIRVPTPNSEVHDIEVDSRGNVWFTEFSDYASKVGKYVPFTNAFSEYFVMTPTAKPQGLALNETGGTVNVWFTEYGGRKIGRLRQPEGPTVSTTVYSLSSIVTTSSTVTSVATSPIITGSKTIVVAATSTPAVTSTVASTVSSTIVDTVSVIRTSPTYWTYTYTYTTSTSFTTTTTTYKLTVLSVESTSSTTSITSTHVSTSMESVTILTSTTVLSVSWFSQTTSTTATVTQTSTIFSPTVTVPTTTTSSGLTTVYSPTVTLTSTTSTGTTTSTTSTLMTTTTTYSPTITLTSTTTTTTTAFPLTILRPCIIASAAYGSELAEPVQSLREFRDHRVQSTFAGAEFMKAFNSFYYSFSPKVASIVASSQFVAAPVRLLLYPLIHILQASSTIFGALTSAPDVGVIVAGVFSSALLGIVYITPTALGIQYLLKKKSNVKRLEVTPVAERRAEQE